MSAAVKPEAGLQTLMRRVNCNGRGNFVVYESRNGDGGYHMICLNGFVAAGCSILLAGGAQVITNLQNKVVGWVNGKIDDASDAGPQTKRSKVVGWVNGKVDNASDAGPQTHSLTAVPRDLGSAPHPPRQGRDGDVPPHQQDRRDHRFSAPRGRLLGFDLALTRCEQIHIHYWAASGHDSTLLSSSEIGSLVVHGLNDAIAQNRGQACYEMTNNGNWDGWLRVCFNDNVPQPGCYTCGGHNN
ncbi:hypothetical protein EKO27_g8959 [Xylaria grammica]|uniref:Uncharacterized protein n=1 Tax=Xylaria grammica TaxID=363999 RepID=A0A439CVC6_9PEZI|nr:hypothetical protein EKO27_g8959 [Xylaria grammica]